MNITIDINGDAKEIAALIDKLRERPSSDKWTEYLDRYSSDRLSTSSASSTSLS